MTKSMKKWKKNKIRFKIKLNKKTFKSNLIW